MFRNKTQSKEGSILGITGGVIGKYLKSDHGEF